MSRETAFLISAIGFACALVAVACLHAALTGGIPMPPETHGMALYAVPGWLWSVACLIQALLMVMFAQTRLYGPLAATCAFGGVINIVLACFSAEAPMGFLISRITYGIAMIHLCCAGLAVAHAFKAGIIEFAHDLEELLK